MSKREERIEKLNQFIKEDENDSFSRYALAIDYVLIGELEKAKKHFETLLLKDPAYLGTYYHYGKLLESMLDFEEASKLYDEGMRLTEMIGDAHANKELKEAMNLLNEKLKKT